MRRKLAAVLACVLTVSALAACGAEGTNGTEGSEVTLAEATLTPSVELAVVEEGKGLHELPVEEYVTLGDYKNMTLEVPAKEEISEDLITSNKNYYFQVDLENQAAEFFKTEGAVADGDWVLIDYEGKKDGVAFSGGTAKDAVLGIGTGTFIDGFEEGLVGVKVGETVDLNLTFPANYSNTDLAGAKTVFTVTVKGLVPYNDETIKALGYEEMTTVAEYEGMIKGMLEYEAEALQYENLMLAICEELLAISEVKMIPESIFEEQKNYVIEQVQAEAAYFGTDGDTYTNVYIGVNLADYAITVAEEYAKQAIVFQAVANAEDLNPTAEDIDAYVADFITLYGEAYGVADEAAFYEIYTEDDVRLMIMQENVSNFISENAKITEK